VDIKIYDKLAKKYDFATKIVSFGIEEFWRWLFVKEIKKYISDGLLLDVASATGEMVRALDFKENYLVEPSKEMIEVAVKKLANNCEVKRSKFIEIDCKKKKYILIQKRVEELDLNKEFDLITAFMAIRNFDNIKKSAEVLKKHLKIGGYIAIVEMVKDDSLISKIVLWYMKNVVPYIAGIIVGMKEEYKLLGDSIERIEERDILEEFKELSVVVRKKLIFPFATLIIMRRDG